MRHDKTPYPGARRHQPLLYTRSSRHRAGTLSPRCDGVHGNVVGPRRPFGPRSLLSSVPRGPTTMASRWCSAKRAAVPGDPHGSQASGQLESTVPGVSRGVEAGACRARHREETRWPDRQARRAIERMAAPPSGGCNYVWPCEIGGFSRPAVARQRAARPHRQSSRRTRPWFWQAAGRDRPRGGQRRDACHAYMPVGCNSL